MKVLVTGGSGFIGSTIASACIDAGIIPVVLDNHSTGRSEFSHARTLYEGDIADGHLINSIFSDHSDIYATIHCAARIVVSESVVQPFLYYRENVSKSVLLVEHLIRNGCKRLIYSSSASVYEPDSDFSVDEESTVAPSSPYARTKAIVDDMLGDIVKAAPIRTMSLRYFNPIGADPKMRSGLQVAAPRHVLGKMIGAYQANRAFEVTGTDYPTRDGTGIRDYIHVWDLAVAHVAALTRFDEALDRQAAANTVINIGTGAGTTVLELLQAFNEVAGVSLQVEFAPRRPGDSVGAFTRSTRARHLLAWTPDFSIHDAIGHALEWERHREY